MLLNTNISVAGFIPSKYNILCSTSEGVILLYNLLYKNLIALGKDDYDEIQRGMINPKTQLGRTLVEMKYVISETENELDYYIFYYNRSHFDTSGLCLSILTSLACNFSCPYCYEKKDGSHMNDTVASQVIKWVSNQIEDKQILSVNWFGGEPLLNLKAIRLLSYAFISLCKKNNTKYQAGITTNGYLLTPEVIDVIENCNIFDVQITFDGSEFYHDKYKHLSNGEGSYKKIVSNIAHYCAISKSHNPLRIRINVTDENFESIETLLDQLPNVVKEHSSVFFRWVYPTETAEWKEFSKDKSGEHPYQGIYYLLKMAHDKGFHIENRCESNDFCFCEADNPGFYTIDPKGFIYLCVHDYKPDYSIGHVSQNLLVSKQSQFYAFKNVSVLNDTKCLECKMLPICNGGCRKSRLEGKKQCIFEKDNIDLFVENIYHKYV